MRWRSWRSPAASDALASVCACGSKRPIKDCTGTPCSGAACSELRTASANPGWAISAATSRAPASVSTCTSAPPALTCPCAKAPVLASNSTSAETRNLHCFVIDGPIERRRQPRQELPTLRRTRHTFRYVPHSSGSVRQKAAERGLGAARS
ncbi:hypothetical protein B0X78_10155 [bacterium AM6]|nr:hypothetical protein B0X78_10155 [bacterium AM6]